MFAVHVDMGKDNAVSLPWLVEETTIGGRDAVLYFEHMTYNLFSVCKTSGAGHYLHVYA